MLDVPFLGETSDELLASRAGQGSRSAFATLMARYQDRIYRLALRMSRNSGDAEEITQEAFLQAHRGIASFQGESRFRTWLYRVAVNQALMHRRAARRRPTQSLDAMDGAEPVVPAGAEPPDGADDLSDRKALVERVREALARLDDPHRAALVLRDLEELSADEAAAILGASPEAVRQRAHRARLKLRECLLDMAPSA